MCFCVCSLPRAFVERQRHDQPQDLFVGITTFSDVCTERVEFIRTSTVDKLIILEQQSPDVSAAWPFFRNVQLIDVLIFLDEQPNLFEIPTSAPPLPNAAGGEAVSFVPPPPPPPSPVPSTSYAHLTPVPIQSPDLPPPSYDEIYHYHFHSFSSITIDSDSEDDDSGLETN